MTDNRPTDVEQALAWLIDNTEGVIGLNMDGSMMPWNELLPRYLPWWSAPHDAEGVL